MSAEARRPAAGAHPPLYWRGDLRRIMAGTECLRQLDRGYFAVVGDRGLALVDHGQVATQPSPGDAPCLGYIAAALAEQLGHPGFRAAHGTRYAYMAGAMANGIASAELVVALGRRGLLGSFGTGGLGAAAIDEAVRRIIRELPDGPFAVCVLHNPVEPRVEAEQVELLLRHQVTTVEASAYLMLSKPIVRYRVSGARDRSGQPHAAHRIIAKVSRPEVAARFLRPPPDALVDELVRDGAVTREQAAVARRLPMADDITVEADSGGHTDNRPLVALLPALLALRDEVQREQRYAVPPRVGAGGGISTPAAVWGALQLGADYVVTGSINQACVEAATSSHVKRLLAAAEMADVMMAPAADMFELGVKVQVLKRGTMFALNAQKLYELYRSYPSLAAIPADERQRLETRVFRMTFDEIWREVVGYFTRVAPQQIARAESDAKHRMALVFRWYLGNSSRWAITGAADRVADMQVWCGQAMGAFNTWVKGTYLQAVERRTVADIALHLLTGAAYLGRVNAYRALGGAGEIVPYLPDEALA